MAAVVLVGPPEIYQAPTATSTATGDAFVDLMEANFNDAAVHHSPPMGLTENESPTFISTGDPCLDFFFHVVPDTQPETLTNRLQLAWSCDPLKALKLVCNLRGVRGTGKSDKEGFYTAALWLHEHHPKTLAANVAAIAEFGYYKDLLEILFRLLEGSEARESARSDGRNWKLWVSAKERFKKLEKEYFEMRNKLPGWSEDLSEEMKESRLELKEEMKEMRKSLYEEKRQRTQLRKLLFVIQTHEEKRIGSKGRKRLYRGLIRIPNSNPCTNKSQISSRRYGDAEIGEIEQNQPGCKMVPLSRFSAKPFVLY